MGVRIWRSTVVEKVYWGRVAAVALAGLGCAMLFDGSEVEVQAAYAPVALEQPVEREPFAAGYLISNGSGVIRGTGGEQSVLWEGSAYDTLSAGEDLFVSARYDDQVVHLKPGAEPVSLHVRGPVDCELDGATLVVVANGSSEVVGIDVKSGETLWQVGGFNNHYDVALLPEGGFVVADSGNGRVVEFNAERTQIAEYADLGFPSSVEVLPNGNLQVTTYHDGDVLELERGSGAEVRRLHVDGTVFRALLQSDGTTLVYEGHGDDGDGQVHRFDATGELLEVYRVPSGVDFEGSL